MKPDDYLEDGDERDRLSTGSIFASGWFRAVLVLGVLAITLVVTVPYLLRWMDPSPAKTERQVARPVEPRPVAAPVPIPAHVPAPVAPAAAVPPTPPTTTWSTVRTTPAPTPTPPAAVTPAPVSPHAQVAAPAPKTTTPGVASTPITERLVPAPAQMAERDSKPAKPSLAEADSRAGEPAAKKAAPMDTGTAKKPAPADGAPAKVAAAPTGRAGDFWVQVGAFQREDNAEALARSVREKTKMPARITSRSARADAPAVTSVRHEVFVSGAQVPAVNAALRGHGSAHAVRGGVAVQPPLEFKEAVALSRRLSGEGMNVKVRRVGGEAAAADPAVAYVVRVGGFGTRAQAEAAKRELASKGVTGFVTPVSTAAAR